MNILWAPELSESAKEVYRNLTGREKAAIYTLTLLFGLGVSVLSLSVMGAVMSTEPVHWMLGGVEFLLFLCLVAGACFALRLQRRLLSGSQFARDNGITRAELFARDPMTRGYHRILGGIAALAILLAGILAAFLIA